VSTQNKKKETNPSEMLEDVTRSEGAAHKKSHLKQIFECREQTNTPRSYLGRRANLKKE